MQSNQQDENPNQRKAQKKKKKKIVLCGCKFLKYCKNLKNGSENLSLSLNLCDRKSICLTKRPLYAHNLLHYFN